MKILGISAYYHDSAAAVIKDGKIIAAAAEERFTRKKNDPDFPLEAIKYCLRQAECALEDLDAVVFYEKPLQKFDRIVETYINSAPWGMKSFVKTFPAWIKQKLFLRAELTRRLKNISANFSPEKILFSAHHLSHAASAFYPSPFKNALVVTFDGVGEWSTTSVAIGSESKLEIKKEIHFPNSLGILYSTLTSYLGFKVNSGEYKVMGLAPYGTPHYFDLLFTNLVKLSPDGAFQLNQKYFDFGRMDAMYSTAFEKLMPTPPRRPESSLEQIHMDLAASLQKLLQDLILHMLEALQAEYQQENLCLAGGVALNCVANSKVLKSGLFKNVWVQPAAGDSGGSWGAALAAYHLHFNKARQQRPIDESSGMYLGPSFTHSEIEGACKSFGLHYRVLSDEEILDETVLALANANVVGWFQGRMEFGPRALGARSILADPRPPETQSKLNLKIKFRESFRPFAPVVIEDDVGDYFDWTKASPYMMFVAELKKHLRFEEPVNIKQAFGLERLKFPRSRLPAVTHLDYTARLQTITRLQNKKLYELLLRFKQKQGISVLVNTSFNVRGEPIVCSPRDAIECFLATDIDILVMENIFITKAENSNLPKPQKRQFDLD